MTSTGRDNLLGPLTTTFTPPATCSVLGINQAPASRAYAAQQCYTTSSELGTTVQFTDSNGSKTSVAVSATVTTLIYSYGIGDDATCRPSTTSTSTTGSGAYGFYSPGLICPSGWYRACTGGTNEDGSPLQITGAHATTFPFGFSPLPGETAYGCCPPNYYCANNPQTCQSLVTTGKVEVTYCTDNTNIATSTLSFPTTSGTITVATMTAYAPLIQIVFQSSDVKSVVTVTQAPDSGLDTGDKAAIGVGVVALIVLGFALVLGVLLLRRRRSRKSWMPTEPGAPNGHPIYETAAKEHNTAAETDGIPLTELADPQTNFERSRW